MVTIPDGTAAKQTGPITALLLEAIRALALVFAARRDPDDPQRRALLEGSAELKLVTDLGRGVLVLGLERVGEPLEVFEAVSCDPEDPSTFGRSARELLDRMLANLPAH